MTIPSHIKKKLIFRKTHLQGGHLVHTLHKFVNGMLTPVRYMKRAGRVSYVPHMKGAGIFGDLLRKGTHGLVDFGLDKLGVGMKRGGSARSDILMSLSASKVPVAHREPVAKSHLPTFGDGRKTRRKKGGDIFGDILGSIF